MTHIDLAFHLVSRDPIPADHGYALFAAVSRILPDVHRENGLAIHPIRGRQIGDRLLTLMPWSTLTFRVRDGHIAPLLKLAGKSLELNGAALKVGVPQVHALQPAATLRSRLVVLKVAHTDAAALNPENFTAALRRQLDDLGISSHVEILIPPHRTGPLKDRPLRRTLTIKGTKIVGYEVLLHGLTAEESLTIQSHEGVRSPTACPADVPPPHSPREAWLIPPTGLGGRRHMGCGVFVPYMRGKEVR
ncbi:MAG: type I-MYXAN CRISPR-associated protein Cas6/Cmx6 [Planctomycetaceae bacterium]|nr:type I-MYXAN CRISPR-associated protein Cas6/Cmx6 [Planctomycetaceae bacterium]